MKPKELELWSPWRSLQVNLLPSNFCNFCMLKISFRWTTCKETIWYVCNIFRNFPNLRDKNGTLLFSLKINFAAVLKISDTNAESNSLIMILSISCVSEICLLDDFKKYDYRFDSEITMISCQNSLFCSVHISCVDQLFYHLACEFRLLWWVDPGWMPDAHPSYSIAPFLGRTGDRKYNKRLVGGDEDRERSLTNDCHRQNRQGSG